MKKTNLVLSILLVFAAVLSACSPAAAPAVTQAATAAVTPTPVTFTDGLGRSVTLDKAATRIVSMAPSATEMLYAIGAGSQLVGRDSFSDYPEEAKSLQDIGGSDGNYSYEAIAALNPDLVVAAEINTADQVKALENLGLKVYYISNPFDFTSLFDEMNVLGQLTDHEAEAKTATDALAARVQTVKDTISQASTTPTVFYELDGSDPSKPWTVGPGNFMDQVISLAGGKNVGSDLTSSWAQISVEDLLVKDPAIIVLGDSNYGMTAEKVAARTGWENLSAVKNNQIFAFDDNLISRAGPRMVDGLEAMAKLVHPELFK